MVGGELVELLGNQIVWFSVPFLPELYFGSSFLVLNQPLLHVPNHIIHLVEMI